MKGLETGKDKIQKICDTLRKETLEPAKQEAREIVENAHMQASQIVREAEERAAQILKEAHSEMEEKKRVFGASLALAARQGIEQLKQKIEKELFNPELASLIVKEMAEPKTIANLLNSLIKIMEEQGLDGEMAVLIPKQVSPRAITEFLTAKVLEKVKHRIVASPEIGGGVQIQLKDRQITVDVSDAFVRELLAQYIRRDLRDLVFNV